MFSEEEWDQILGMTSSELRRFPRKKNLGPVHVMADRDHFPLALKFSSYDEQLLVDYYQVLIDNEGMILSNPYLYSIPIHSAFVGSTIIGSIEFTIGSLLEYWHLGTQQYPGCDERSLLIRGGGSALSGTGYVDAIQPSGNMMN